MSERKTWRMAVLAFGVLALMAILGGCQALLPLEEQAAMQGLWIGARLL